eukprot:3930070-Karenia_brevis.AAC.1
MPGMDGVLYSAWAAGGVDAAWIWIPKKPDLPGMDFAHPKPGDTRPLGLKNSDIKICTGVVCHKVAPVCTALLNEIQQGFTRGRNFVINVA